MVESFSGTEVLEVLDTEEGIVDFGFKTIEKLKKDLGVTDLEKLMHSYISPEIKYSNLRKEDDPNYNVGFDKRKEDAGFDVWAMYEEQDMNSRGEINIVIPQGQTKLVSLGIATAFDSKHFLSLKHERSSVGSKGVFVNAGLIDSGFRNGWKLCLTPIAGDLIITNKVKEFTKEKRGDKTLLYYPYTKAIGQVVVGLNLDSKSTQVPYEDLLQITSERGLGGFGSTN